MLLIFDLDGTLIDSSKDLAISVNATLMHLGRAPLDEALIHSYVGDGAATLVKRSLGADATEELSAQALAFFLQFYRAHALEHTRLYDGLRPALDRLRADKHWMAVLTNKPVRISQDILTALGVAEHFFRVYGGDSLPEKKPAPLAIHKLRDEARAAAGETMMIGDSGVDVQTARNAGVISCGVRWGIQPESFNVFPPDYEVASAEELLALFQQAKA